MPDQRQGKRQQAESEGLISHPNGVVCEQKCHRREMALDHQDGAEGSRDWDSV